MTPADQAQLLLEALRLLYERAQGKGIDPFALQVAANAILAAESNQQPSPQR